MNTVSPESKRPPAHAVAPSWRRQLLVAAFTLTVFGLALWGLQQALHGLELRQVMQAFRVTPASHIAIAALFAAGSYVALTMYDVIALAIVGRKLPYRRVAVTSFIASALAHNLGLGSLSGGSVRLRSYTREGLGAAEVALVQGIFSATFLLGAGSLFALSLLLQTPTAADVLHLSPAMARSIALALLAVFAAYLVAAAMRREPLRVLSWRIRLPRARQALGQFGASSADLACAAACLYVLLPHGAVPYPAFVGLYVTAIAAGTISNVPGGLGVFESVLLLLLPGVPAGTALGAILMYRAIYYLAPFIIALLAMVARELAPHRARLSGAAAALQRSAASVAPQALAMAVFAGGSMLLVSGSLPAAGARLRWMSGAVPLPVVELSHLAGSAIGVALLILARGLMRRLDAAWWLTQWLLGAGIAASLLKGFDFEEASILLLLLILLRISRDRFYRRAPLSEVRLSPAWMLNVAIVVAAAIWLGLMAYRHVDYANELWWRFAFNANAPRMLRGSLVAVMLCAAYALWQLLSPEHSRSEPPTREALEHAARCVALSRDTTANLALLGDKQLLFADDGDALIMYQRSGRSLIAMGDPVGNPERFEELAWRFRELCDAHGAACVFYQVTADWLPLYLDLGLTLAKLGEEARVPLQGFSLEGSKRADLRTALRKGEREGLRFEVWPAAMVAQRIDELQRVSDAWLRHKATAEKGFSIGRFSRDYMLRFDCAVALRGEQLVAFANLWKSAGKEELSVDLMRYGEEAPKGVMDYLFVQLLQWGHSNGYHWFNLGMAPLSGLEQHPLAPLWHKLGLLVHRFGESFYNFEGLRRYKEKFGPIWRPRYLASPGGIQLPRVVVEAATLISGGVREIVRK